MLRIHSIESLGTFDGPGIRQVFFLQGCNFKCLYCANPDTIEYGVGREYEIEDLVNIAKSQKPFYGKKGGITVSGGEPLMQAKNLIQLFQKLKEKKIHTCIDTNGSILTSDVKELFNYTDLVLLDIKQYDNIKHIEITGESNVRTLKFLDYLEKISKPTWVRYVLVPDLTDDEEDIHNLGRLLATKKNVEKVEIQPYHALGVHKYAVMEWEYKLADTPHNTPEALEKVKNIFLQYVKEVVIN